jgi:hypothetical protein
MHIGWEMHQRLPAQNASVHSRVDGGATAPVEMNDCHLPRYAVLGLIYQAAFPELWSSKSSSSSSSKNSSSTSSSFLKTTSWHSSPW